MTRPPAPRRVVAPNPGPFTLDGSISWVVGHEDVVIVDAGPEIESHLQTLVAFCRRARRVRIALTHGHGDHAGGADRLLSLLRRGRDARAVEVVGSGHPNARPLVAGEEVGTDHGALVCIPTPGHAADHLAFHWPAARALFAGDHVLGRGDTTWVGEYPGCVADYLASLARVRALDLDVIHPGHGPSLTDPAAAVDRFEAHRRDRIRRVADLRKAHPGADADELFAAVYGSDVPAGLEGAARRSLAALVEYVDTEG
jgi:glyoxylase-like metal-dependent hydrolase (beta-lactamase superfamily II)